MQDAPFSDPLFSPLFIGLFLLFIAWSLAWKGSALWKASKNGQKKWFMVMLVLNTFGILEIVYIFYFQKDKNAPPSEKIS